MTEHLDPDVEATVLDADVALAGRWARLDPDERVLVALALTEVHDGTFATRVMWDRYVDAALELLCDLRAGAISPRELHDQALGHALDRHDQARGSVDPHRR